MDKKTKIQTGLIIGVTMAITFILQELVTHPNLTTKDLAITIVLALLGGGCAGLLFVWLMGIFLNSKWLGRVTGIDTQADESILFETGANHFKGIEAVGGKLYLTNKRLVFKSHNFNIQKHELSICLSDIDKVGGYKTLGLTNNGLSVTSFNNKTEKFVVQQVDKWLNLLKERNGLQLAHRQ